MKHSQSTSRLRRATSICAFLLGAALLFGLGVPIAEATVVQPGTVHLSAATQPGSKALTWGGMTTMAVFAGTVVMARRPTFLMEANKDGSGAVPQALQTIKSKIALLKGKANDSLAKMKPLEQHEGAERLGYVFSGLESRHQDLQDLLGHLEDNILPSYEEAMQSARDGLSKDEEFLKKVREQILQSGDYVTKTDADGRVQSAEQAALERARGEVEKELQQAQKLSARRGEAEAALAPILKTAGKDGKDAARELCSKLSDDTLLADGYKETIKGSVERVRKCTELGVSKPEVLQEVCSMADEAYQKQVQTWEDISKSARGGKAARVTPFAAGRSEERQSAGAKPAETKGRVII